MIGADGLHSIVRALAFGPESRFERFLGYTVAACAVSGYRPRADDAYVAYNVPGRQVARFAMRGDRTMFLFIVADPAAPSFEPHDLAHHRAYLREHFRAAGWECPAILDALDASDISISIASVRFGCRAGPRDGSRSSGMRHTRRHSWRGRDRRWPSSGRTCSRASWRGR